MAVLLVIFGLGVRFIQISCLVDPMPAPNSRSSLSDETCGIRWADSLEEAMERGRQEQKPVLLAFGVRKFGDPLADDY